MLCCIQANNWPLRAQLHLCLSHCTVHLVPVSELAEHPLTFTAGAAVYAIASACRLDRRGENVELGGVCSTQSKVALGMINTASLA